MDLLLSLPANLAKSLRPVMPEDGARRGMAARFADALQDRLLPLDEPSLSPYIT